MKRLISWALLVVALGMFAACGDDDNQTLVRQRVLFGTTVGTALLGPSNLVMLNPTTGAFIRTVGSTGYIVNGLAYDQTTGKLFATTGINDPVFPAGLIEINTTTGAGTPIGTGHGLTDTVVSLTVDSAGKLYGWLEPNVDGLVTIDKVTGFGTLVGVPGLSTEKLGLDFDAGGTLWLVDGGGPTYTIDPLTSAATPFGDILVDAHHGKFHPTTGLYWGIDLADGTIATRNINIVDISTSTVLETVPTLDYLHTISFGFKWVLIST